MKLPFSKSTSAVAFTLAALGGLTALSCGHDDKQPLFSSGVDSTKKANTLSDNDKQTYCRTLDQHVDVVIGFQEIARIACLPLALLSVSRDECEQKLNTCSANAPMPVTITGTNTQVNNCVTSLSSCDANVGTLEGCVNVNVGLVRAVLETVTCARFGDPTAMTQASQVMDTASSCAGSSSSCGGAADPILL